MPRPVCRAARLTALFLGWVAQSLGASPTTASTHIMGEAIADSGKRFSFSAGQCGQRIFVEWRDTEGQLAAREEVELTAEGWSRYRLERPTIHQKIIGSVVGRELTLDIERDGVFERNQVTLKRPLVAGPLLIRRLQAALPTLRAGETLELDYLIADQAVVLRLRIQRERDTGGPLVGSMTEGAGVLRVRIQAASPWMRPFVPETWLTFDAEDELIAMRGRLLPLEGPASRPQPVAGVLNLHQLASSSLTAMQSSCNRPALS